MESYRKSRLSNKKSSEKIILYGDSKGEHFLPEVNQKISPEVKKFVNCYLKENRSIINEVLNSDKGRDLKKIKYIFYAFGLPEELSYISIVESKINPNAVSSSGAIGIWQFMKDTGLRYGLTINYFKDERKHLTKSTVAAARHFIDLFDNFNDWNLAVAAYNAGEGTIARAIKNSNTRDFYEIANTNNISQQTKDFVSKFMALKLIFSNPSKFGFQVTNI